MVQADLDQVLAIEAVSFPDPWPRRFFEQEVTGGGGARAVVAVRGERVLGYMVAWEMAGDIHLGNLAVSPAERRSGIARLMLARLIDRAERDGSQSITLEVRVSNRSAIQLYARHRFRPAGLRRGYYRGVEDALIMTREATGTRSFDDAPERREEP
jgi:ribosomal-protein-alanine N-acetyltransferase